MRKRLNGFYLVLVMVLMILVSSMAYPLVGFAGDMINGALDITEYSVDKSAIYEGDEFELTIKLDDYRGSGAPAFSSIKIKFDTNSSFQVNGSPNPVNANLGSNSIDMLYTGGTNLNLPVTIEYEIEGGDFGSTSANLYIKEARPETDTGNSSPPVDLTKYKPVIELRSASIPTGKAGGVIKIPLSITNNSNYEAKNIKITPKLDTLPFVIDQMTSYELVDRMLANHTANIEFQFTIEKNAEKKNYTLPLTIEYKNAYNISFSEEKLIYINIDNTNLPPQLVVHKATSNPPEIKPEENFTVTFDIWNMGTLEAENVTVDLESNNNFYILDNITKKYLFELKGLQNKAITYSLKPKKGLEAGTYGITVLLSHKDLAVPETYTMYVSVLGEPEEEEVEENVNIITENIVTPQSSVLTEQPFTVSFDIKNIGITKAKDVKVSVDSGDKILPQSLNILNISELEAGETINNAFSFIASKDCENRYYPIKAVIEYKNGEEMVKKEQYMGVLIERPEEEDGEDEEEGTLNTVPKIIISEYSSDPGMVKAGENFTLSMTFLNTSKVKAVQNMKITLIVNEGSEATGSVFTPVQSSNTFYIDYLKPGQTSNKEMVMYTIPDARAKTYVVKASFEYEYEEQKQLKTNNMEDVFGIPVVQPAKLETTDVIVQEPAFIGEPVYISSEFYNTGKVLLSNLMVKVEGEFDTKEANYFVGNFDSGYSDYYEASIIPLVPGETKGLLVYTFEDAAGTEHRIEKEFTVNAMEAAPVINPDIDFPGKPGMYPGMEEPPASKFPLIPVIVGGVVLIGVIVLIIVLKKRKKRKELMIDEDI